MKNWKTTALGLGAAVANLVANGMTVKTAVVSVFIAALGTFAKDNNVTGGEIKQ